ncbi:hypothetical protein [Paenibacillus sp. MMS18-CY102]|uniref:hypothetical protein n=1 Tax=Paenibacillus sp. MMS18-CY102 TaxID=2682849 RepID=UPI0013666E24|nr:hypothetical protein [Paenibacillus sp. MMS18-CY102]MWC28517.1 hypothetical protein [Paenibacillus sp. MMS18-CY102]
MGIPLLMALLMSLFLCMSTSIMLTYLAPYMDTVYGMTGSQVGYLLLLLGVIGIIGSRIGANLVLSLNLSIVHIGTALGAGGGGIVASSAGSVRFHPWFAAALMILGLAAASVSFARRVQGSLKAKGGFQQSKG